MIVAAYYLNKTAFAKNCENKEKPALQCKGKCQVAKKIQEEEKKDRQEAEGNFAAKQDVISSKSFFATLPKDKIQFTPIFHTILQLHYPAGKTADIFHPPALA